MKRFFIYVLTLVVILAGSLFIKYLIQGQASVVSMPYNQVAWLTFKGFGTAANSSYIPIVGKDYTIKTAYFDNKQWAVSSINPIDAFSDPATMVFRKSNGNYLVVLGPSNIFKTSAFNSFPNDVVTYLKKIGVVDGETQ